MNVYILEIDAKLKEENNNKRLTSTLSKWDGHSPLYYNSNAFFEFGTDCSKSNVFFDKRKAFRAAREVYKHNYDRLIIENVKILTIKMRLATPLDIRYSQVVEH